MHAIQRKKLNEQFCNEQLFAAIKQGDEVQVEALIRAGADVNAPNDEGRTPLDHATEWKRVNIINILLKNGADINNAKIRIPHNHDYAVNTEGTQAFAAIVKHTVKLESAGLFVSQENLDQKKVFFDKCSKLSKIIIPCFRYREACKAEVKKMKNMNIDRTGKIGTSHHQFLSETNIIKLAEYLSIPAIRKALETGQYKEEFPLYGNLIAIQHEKAKQNQLNNPIVKQAQKSHEHPREIKDIEILKKLNAFEDLSETNIIERTKAVLKEEDPDKYKEWEEDNFNPNHLFKLNYQYGTLLHLACWCEDERIVKFLIGTKIIDVNKELDFQKVSPLMAAAEKSSQSVMEMLLEAGANAEALDREGNTLLHYATRDKKGIDKIQFLIKKGKNVNASNESRETPLHNAARHCPTDIISILLKNGAKVNALDMYNHTPLHNAIIRCSIKTVSFLLENGAKTNVLDYLNNAPLYYAMREGNINIVWALLINGARVNANDIWTLADDSCTSHKAKLATLVIVKHVAKLEIAGVPFSPEILNNKKSFISHFIDMDIIPNYHKELEACEAEVTKMQQVEIGESGISYHQFLVETDAAKLVGYLNNPDFREELEKGEYKEKFPIYAYLIERQYNQGIIELRKMQELTTSLKGADLTKVQLEKVQNSLN